MRISLFLSLVVLLGCQSSVPPSTAFTSRGYQKVWEDGFDDLVLDSSNWTVGLRVSNGDLVPGASGDYLLNDQYDGYITPEDVYIEDGSLVLRNQKREYRGTSPNGLFRYTSGWVMSMHKVFLNEGYVEVRARFPSGDKVWPAIWLIAEDLTWGPEWDLFEYFGYREGEGFDQMGCHLAYGEWPEVKWRSNWIEGFDKAYGCGRWHVYGFEWTADNATWYVDGELVASVSREDVAGEKWPEEEMYLVLNNGVRTESPDEHTKWPNFLTIDYVAIYKRQY